MTKWKELASIFGLEIEEEFKVKFDGEIQGDIYRLTENGIQWKYIGEWRSGGMDDIEDLLTGDAEVIKMPWKPKKGYEIHYWSSVGLSFREWNNSTIDYLLWKAGNCFKTEEEAKTKGKEIMEAIKKEYEEA